MDNYTKAILTVMSILLCVIAFKLFNPTPTAPTFGDFRALRNIADQNKRTEARVKLLNKLPMVGVRGGKIQVSGDVGILEEDANAAISK